MQKTKFSEMCLPQSGMKFCIEKWSDHFLIFFLDQVYALQTFNIIYVKNKTYRIILSVQKSFYRSIYPGGLARDPNGFSTNHSFISCDFKNRYTPKLQNIHNNHFKIAWWTTARAQYKPITKKDKYKRRQ